jgi:hypothetical protein
MTAPHWAEPGPTPVALPEFRGVLKVDPERIEGLVREMRTLVDGVRELERSLDFYQVRAPASDPVSTNVAQQSTVMIEHGRRYLADWRQHLVTAADALEAQGRGYVTADRNARA